MFPTLSSITEYLFGFSFGFPIQTFGVFVALAFISSYLIFQSEFKRKEKEGWIHPFLQEKSNRSVSVTWFKLLWIGLLSFILGYKVGGCFDDYHYFKYNPIAYIFSLKGDMLSGLIFAVLIIPTSYYIQINEQREKTADTKGEQHPYQLMPTLILWAAIWGFLGAKIFGVIENLQAFIAHPWVELSTFTGLTFYGGFIFGALSYLYIGYHKGMKLIHLADIGSPGMLVAYGVGRIGCQLAGDGDWGVVNNAAKPKILGWLPDWMWSFNFPNNVLNRGIYIPQCQQEHCMVLPYPVYPTSFYETVIILTAFFILWTFRKRMKIPGMMFCLFLLVNGIERFFIEFIRVNPKHDFMAFAITQAQIIAFIFIIGGFCGMLLLFKKSDTQQNKKGPTGH